MCFCSRTGFQLPSSNYTSHTPLAHPTLALSASTICMAALIPLQPFRHPLHAKNDLRRGSHVEPELKHGIRGPEVRCILAWKADTGADLGRVE